MRARALARAQASDAQIASLLERDYPDEVGDGEAEVVKLHAELVRERMAGRADLAEFVWDIGWGTAEVEKHQLGMLRSLAYQHLGWTPNGVDDEIRKAREAMEKQPPHKRPSLKVAGT